MVGPQPLLVRLDSAMRQGLEIPAISPSTAEVIQKTQDPNTGLREVAARIQRDPVLAARVIGMANTAMYARGGSATTIEQAVSRLGMTTVRSIAIATCADSLKTRTPELTPLREGLWNQCVAAGIGARLLARHLRHPQSEMLFLAGLFHRIGSLVVLHHVPDLSPLHLPTVHEAVASLEVPAGQRLLTEWEVPEEYRQLFECQHGVGVHPDHARGANIVRFASDAARSFGMGPPLESDLEDLMEHPLVVELGLSEIVVCDLEVELEDLVAEARQHI